MIVVVTGACSNLSSAILPRLVARADVDRVIGLDIRNPSEPIDGVEYRLADVTEPGIAEHFAGAGAVFHLAFVVMGGERDVERTERINIGGSRRVFESAIASGVDHITYASSIASYGAHPDNVGVVLTESSPLRGNRELAYPRTKADVERMIDEIEAAGPTPPIARMRPCAFLGSRGRGSALLERRFFPVLRGIADHPAHFAHQDDVADAFIRAFVRRAGGAFNVATDEPLPSSQWAAHLGKRALPVPGKLAIAALERLEARGTTVDAALIKLGTLGPIVVSSEKARRELGWVPRFPTTADVLRELGGLSTSRARLQTRVILGALAALTRLRGGLPIPADRASDMRGLSGSVDLILGGESPSSWHLIVGEGEVGVGRGRSARAGASVRLDEDVFFDILAGRLETSAATMTGELRFGGDAAMSMVVSGFLTQLGRALRGDGPIELPGFVRRWLLAE